MRKEGVESVERDLAKAPFAESELEALIGQGNHLTFLNPRNEVYRRRGFKDRPPSRAEAIALLAREPNLLRRPLLVRGGEILFGFDPAAYRKMARGR